MLTILSTVAEMDYELTMERNREGMATAKIYGTKPGHLVGQPPRQIPPNFKNYYPMWKDGGITVTDFAKVVGVSRPTLYKYTANLWVVIFSYLVNYLQSL